jgi:hypothetical protein
MATTSRGLRSPRALLAAVLVALALACRSSGPALEAPVDECPVCRVEGDLACLRVRVTLDTPSCTCDGELYHICSEDCREAFLAHPDRYSGR